MNLEKMIILQSLFVHDKQWVNHRNGHFLPPNRWSDRLIRHSQYWIYKNQSSNIYLTAAGGLQGVHNIRIKEDRGKTRMLCSLLNSARSELMIL